MADSTFRGFSFPFDKGKVSFPKGATDETLVQKSIVQIIMTSPGERIMRPEFGSRVISSVFANLGTALENTIRADITEAIARFEPRVTINNITFERADTRLDVTISYTVKLNSQREEVTVNLPLIE